MAVVALASIFVGISMLVVIALLWRRRRPHSTPRVCGSCARVMLPAWDRCRFCGWAPTPRLEFLAGPLAGQAVPLIEEVTTFGSVAGNTVVIADPGVSRKHIGIRRLGASCELADLGSTNGVYCNGLRVAKKELTPGDIVRFGNTEMRFLRE